MTEAYRNSIYWQRSRVAKERETAANEERITRESMDAADVHAEIIESINDFTPHLKPTQNID